MREKSGGNDADARYKFRFRVWWRGELGFEALTFNSGMVLENLFSQVCTVFSKRRDGISCYKLALFSLGFRTTRVCCRKLSLFSFRWSRTRISCCNLGVFFLVKTELLLSLTVAAVF